MTRAVLDYVMPWLVDHPDDVEISEVSDADADAKVLEISVHPDDVGKVIGRRGRIIRSLRAVSRAAGQRQGENVTVEVAD